MPRVRSRTVRARRGELTDAEFADLSSWTGIGASAFTSPTARRAAWRAHRAELMAFYAERRPGEAPEAYWTFEGPPELRTEPAVPITVLVDDDLLHRTVEAREAFRAGRREYLATIVRRD